MKKILKTFLTIFLCFAQNSVLVNKTETTETPTVEPIKKSEFVQNAKVFGKGLKIAFNDIKNGASKTFLGSVKWYFKTKNFIKQFSQKHGDKAWFKISKVAGKFSGGFLLILSGKFGLPFFIWIPANFWGFKLLLDVFGYKICDEEKLKNLQDKAVVVE